MQTLVFSACVRLLSVCHILFQLSPIFFSTFSQILTDVLYGGSGSSYVADVVALIGTRSGNPCHTITLYKLRQEVETNESKLRWCRVVVWDDGNLYQRQILHGEVVFVPCKSMSFVYVTNVSSIKRSDSPLCTLLLASPSVLFMFTFHNLTVVVSSR